tara:strand:- start:300 stop:425 length:126 start_codon:yes stop_codon:yes gene_type:complete
MINFKTVSTRFSVFCEIVEIYFSSAAGALVIPSSNKSISSA